MNTALYLYVSSNGNGILIIPEKNGRPDPDKRVLLGGNPDYNSLNACQLEAIIQLLFRDKHIVNKVKTAYFLDANNPEAKTVLLKHVW
jgi:hypothetical protein